MRQEAMDAGTRATALAMAGLVLVWPMPLVGCSGGDGNNVHVTADDGAIGTSSPGETATPSDDRTLSESVVSWKEPSLEELPENRTADEIEAAVDDYIGRTYPDRKVTGRELIGEDAYMESTMWASYLVHFQTGNDIGLEVTASSTSEPDVTEERYLKSANGLYYDVETKRYVNDLEVFGGAGDDEVTTETQGEEDANVTQPEPTKTESEEKPVLVKNDNGEEVWVIVGDLEP